LRVKKTELVKRLARESLEHKWILNQSSNLKRLFSPCSFCLDVINNHNSKCSKCNVPKILCSDFGDKGLIGLILAKFGNSLLNEIEPFFYDLVRDCLTSLKENGYLSKKLKKKITKLYFINYLSKKLKKKIAKLYFIFSN